MNDIFHQWGSDLIAGSCGDLSLAIGSDAVSQRVCRRLLTNTGDYLWNLKYGGGLAQFVGEPADPAEIEAIVRAQLRLEAAVPTTPAPAINVEVANAASGSVVATISYSDTSTALPVEFHISTG